MLLQRSSSSIFAFVAAGAIAPTGAVAQVAVTTGPSITISQSSNNILNLLSPYLDLNATRIGRQTLATNLSQSIATNNNATPILQALAVSDKNLFGGLSSTITLANGTSATYGIAANLAGGLPAQAAVNPAPGATTTTPTVPIQAVGGLASVLGPIFQQGVTPTTVGGVTTVTGGLAQTAALLNVAYGSLASRDLGVAKNFFADGGANSSVTYAADQRTVTSATTNPAVAPAGFTLPTANGLPNRTDSVYDLAYGVTNAQAGQDVFGSSRPTQVSARINNFDSTSLNQLAGNPSFPSGHTTYAYTDSILIGMLVPQEFQSMLSRASEYANSRIVLGVHYPLDIIASRALVQYDLSQAFTNPAYQNGTATTASNFTGNFNLLTQFAAARTELTTYLQANCGNTVATCAASAANTANDPYVPSSANFATYTRNLTYGLPTLTYAQAPREAASAGGPDASVLLAPVFGGSTTAAQTIAPNGGTLAGLSTTTVNQIIVNTETNALAAFYGTPLSYWTRINLYAAAGYFSDVIGTTSLATTDVVNVPVTIGSGGVLDANGTVNGATKVTSGGTLTGAGTVNGTVAVDAGATLAPGSLAAQTAMAGGGRNVAGTRLAVNGAVGFAPGSTLGIFATSTQVTSATATGTATLTGAKVKVTLPTVGPFVTSKNNLVFVAAGGLTGKFAGVTTNLLFATPTLGYDQNTSVFLSFGNPNFKKVATTQNQVNVAAALNRSAALNLAASIPAALALFETGQAGQARTVLDSLSGSGLIGAQNAAFRSSALFTSAMFDQTTFYGQAATGGAPGNSITLSAPLPGSGFIALAPADGGRPPLRELADLPARHVEPVFVAPPRAWRVWASGFGGVETIHGSAVAGSTRQDDTIYGGALGVDYQLTPNYLVGVALGGSDGSFDVAGRATSGSTTGGHVAIYDLATFGPFYGASSTAFSYYTNKTTRDVAGFGALGGETERGTFDSHEFRSRLEFGRHFDGYGATVTPFVALELAELRSNGFNETAQSGPGLFALNVGGQSTASVPGFVGARFQRITPLGGGLVLSPTLEVSYVHEFAPQRTQFGTFVDLPGSTFLVNGANPSYNAAKVKAGGEIALNAQSALFANFDGEFSGASQFYAGKGGFRWVW